MFMYLLGAALVAIPLSLISNMPNSAAPAATNIDPDAYAAEALIAPQGCNCACGFQSNTFPNAQFGIGDDATCYFALSENIACIHNSCNTYCTISGTVTWYDSCTSCCGTGGSDWSLAYSYAFCDTNGQGSSSNTQWPNCNVPTTNSLNALNVNCDAYTGVVTAHAYIMNCSNTAVLSVGGVPFTADKTYHCQ